MAATNSDSNIDSLNWNFEIPKRNLTVLTGKCFRVYSETTGNSFYKPSDPEYLLSYYKQNITCDICGKTVMEHSESITHLINAD
jgi:NAD-dependent SIR2 family protein deacetylase